MSDFSIFIFRVMVFFVHFCTQITPIFDEFNDNSKNKNPKISFLFDSAHCASFMETGSKLRGGGKAPMKEVCISLVGGPNDL